MKNLLSFLIAAICFTQVNAQYPDLPGGGSPFNVQTMPAGSYIIAMDNQYQGSGTGTFTTSVTRAFSYTNGSNVLTGTNTSGIVIGMILSGQGAIPAGAVVTAINPNVSITISANATNTQNNRNINFGYITYSGADFNLKTYGLLVTLMNNNKRLKWVIKPGKALDAADFTVSSVQQLPTLGTTASRSFAGGPFVIFQQDTAGVAAIVNTFNAAVAPDVKIYRTTADVDVDVRYDYLINGVIWKPKAAILNDGGKAAIHAAYMTTASVPAGNYTIETTPNFVTGCYTFASEPHNDAAPAAVIQGIRTFVTNGGNFLAQCAAVRTYELSTLARFQSTNGFDNANENGGPATWTNSNTDMPYFQINGYFGIEDVGGSLKSWVIPQAPGNPPTNNFHVHNSGAANGFNYTNASVSKLVPSSQLGGMVFYLGSHDYAGNSDFNINGTRLYLNAFMVPTNPQGSLTTGVLTQCLTTLNDPTVVTFTSPSGPTNAYPLTFNLYADVAAPFGSTNITGDVFLGTATITAAGQTPTVTIPANSPYRKNTNYVAVITPNSGCLQPIAKVPNSCATTLPVEFKSFTAARSTTAPETVMLKWATSSELNNTGFEVEVNKGGNWLPVGFVPSKATDGNSSTELNYTFTDINNARSVSQYRLRQVDRDSRSKYSDVRSVRGLDQKGTMIVYPNPSNDGRINVVFDDNNTIRDLSVQDMSGRIIKQMNGISTNNILIDNLVSGMYSIRVINRSTGEMTVQKVVVNKR